MSADRNVTLTTIFEYFYQYKVFYEINQIKNYINLTRNLYIFFLKLFI